MTALQKTAEPRSRLLKVAGLAAAGGVAGYLIATVLMRYVELPSPDVLRWSDAVALIVALMMFGGGVSVLVAARNGRALAAVTSAEGSAGPEELRDMRLQSVILVL